MLLLLSADFFQNQLFQQILSGTLPECQAVWICIRMDIVSALIWVQTVCKGDLLIDDKVAASRKELSLLRLKWGDFLFDSLRPINNLSVI